MAEKIKEYEEFMGVFRARKYHYNRFSWHPKLFLKFKYLMLQIKSHFETKISNKTLPEKKEIKDTPYKEAHSKVKTTGTKKYFFPINLIS